MPIPSNLVTHAEIVMNGISAAGGSNVRLWAFVHHFRRTGTALPINKLQVETAFQGAIAVPTLAALNVTYAQTNTSVRWVNDAFDAPLPFTRSNAGAIAGDRMATSEAAFILLRTGLRGKSFRGNKHLGPMSESDSTSGTDDIFNAAALTRLAAVASAILAGFTDAAGNVWVPAVLSRTLSQLRLNPTIVVANDVISVAVNKRIGSMVRRKVKSIY